MRRLARNRLYSVINVVGISIGIACSLLLFAFIRFENSYDAFQRAGDRTFRVVTQRTNADGSAVRVGLSPLPLAQTLKENFPQIGKSVAVTDDRVTVIRDADAFNQPVLFATSSFFEVFSFPLVRGDPHTALSNPNSIILTEAVARKMFGDEDAMGKRLTVGSADKREVVVSGIAADPPSNTNIPFEAVLPFQLYPGYEHLLVNWGSSNCYTFVQLHEEADPAALVSGLGGFVDQYFGERIRQGRESGSLSSKPDAWRLRLQPLLQIHTDPSVRWSLVPTVNSLQSSILAGIAVLILGLACMNYAILGIARSAERVREIGLRKVVGAGKWQVMLQLWSEAFVVVVVAAFLGVVLAEASVSLFSRLTLRQLSLSDILSFPLVVSSLLGLAFIALCSGGYPALVLTRLNPVDALRTKLNLIGKNAAGKALVVIQFMVGIALMVGAAMMARQMSFVEQRDLGYSPGEVLVVRAGGMNNGFAGAFMSEASAFPSVAATATVNNTFSRGGMRTDVNISGKQVKTEVYFVNADFLHTLGIPLEEGKDFPHGVTNTAGSMAIVNRTFVREAGWTSPIGKRLALEGSPEILGVVRDFNFESLKNEVRPAIFILNPPASAGNVLLKLRSDNLGGTISRLKQAWRHVAPLTPFEYYFLGSDIRRQYADDERWTLIIVSAALISLVIAGLGLFGMASLSVTRRTKEVGVRKVLGASVSGILSLLSKDLLALVVVANVLAWPVAYFGLERWLETFAYRVHWDLFVFLLCGAGSVALAALAMTYQAVKAALTNPVEALRYE